MTVSVTSAAKPQKTRSIRKAMLRQRTEKNEWQVCPAVCEFGWVRISALRRKSALTGRTAA